ncbi:ParB N-terminal domain-containing protein [Urbifossiella limnaea]|uniref:Transcriptional regulator NovG n=1 Tax=Urbifossiella limnaea TaxID=2528023 RepID=A0A517XSU2_9BACT|nr:hypothetical protein [Urbifossiella limnaea]QDU20600.1 Transcriptional regulator NovG [Urbifossiella limnaea]
MPKRSETISGREPAGRAVLPVRGYLFLAELRMEVSARVRVKPCPDTITRYAEVLADDQSFSPVVVFRDPDGVLWLADGWHRVEAAKVAGRDKLVSEIHEGSEADAFLYAAQANLKHGLAATKADRKQVATLLLRSPEWGAWGDREIGRLSGLNDKTVATLRKELSAENPQKPSAEIPQMRVVRRKGTTYTMATGQAKTAIPNTSGASVSNSPNTDQRPEVPSTPVVEGPADPAPPIHDAAPELVSAPPSGPPVDVAPPAPAARTRDWATDPLDIDFMIDSGLLFELNRRVLHPFGIRLVVRVADTGEKSWGLKDCRSDPRSLSFPPAVQAQAEEKFARFLEAFGRAQLDRPARREESIGS